MITDTTNNNQVFDAKSIAEALNGKRKGAGKWLALCPAHAERTPSFYIQEGRDVAVVFKCFGGCKQSSIMEALKGMGLWSNDDGIVAPRDNEKSLLDHEQERLKAKAKALQIWHQSRVVQEGNPVHTYLTKTRCLPLKTIPSIIRCNHDLEYWVSGEPPVKVTSSPAMVAAIQNVQGDIIAVHRTYLTHTGEKLNLAKYGYEDAPVKKVQGKEINGGAIRLQEPADILVVAEGIETALAAHILSGLPAWAAVSAGGLERIEIPDSVRTVYICVDNDAAGKRAAAGLTDRLTSSGKEVFWAEASACTSVEKADWCDVLGGTC